MVTKGPSKTTLIRQILKDAGEKFNTHPFDVTKVQFYSVAKKRITEWDLRKLGGFDTVKKSMFKEPKRKKPEQEYPVHPLAEPDLKEKSVDELVGPVVDAIADAAAALKLSPCNLTWYEFAKYIGRWWGKDNLHCAQYTITRAGGYNAIRDAHFAVEPNEITVHKQRLQKQAQVNRRLGNVYAEERFLFDRLEEFVDRIYSGRVEAVAPPKSQKHPDRILNLVLSDLHFGSNISKTETGRFDFGTTEEARRIAAVVKQVCEYKRQYRGQTKLHIYLIGDIIENLLHSAQDGAVLSEQCSRAIHILIQVIAYLATEFPEIEIFCLTGNHGRFVSKNPKRAVHEKYDSLETIIYSAVRMACKNLTNVKFTIPRTPYHVVDLFGSKAMITHGDGVFEIGNPSKSISFSRLESQANAINAALAKEGAQLDLFIIGHVHRFTVNGLDNGSTVVTNSALVPPNPFAVNIGIFNGQCGQVLFESVPNFPLGDMRLIKVGVKEDQDESLDSIVVPWTDY